MCQLCMLILICEGHIVNKLFCLICYLLEIKILLLLLLLLLRKGFRDTNNLIIDTFSKKMEEILFNRAKEAVC